MNARQLAKGLGWFSLGLGLLETVAPRALGRWIGVRGHDEVLRRVGLRELLTGAGLLQQPHSPAWMWARVGGDLLDLALLSAAFGARRTEPRRLAAALGAVGAVAALDVWCGRQLHREQAAGAMHPDAQGALPEPAPLTLSAAEGASPDFARGSVFFVGTATVLLRYAGFTILTDPNFLHQGDHVHLGYGLTAERLTEPALNIDGLPALDFVVLSHYHGDHFDQVAEAQLDKQLPIITTRHAAAALRDKGFVNARPLETWQTQTLTKGGATLRLTAMPGIHGPGPLQALLPPVMGSMLEFAAPNGQTALRLYLTGDTLFIDELKEIPQRYPEVDLMLIHLGGTRIFGVMLTMDAEQGVATIRLINPRRTVPIHYNDYEVFKSPLEDFVRAVEEAGLSERVVYLHHGETYDFEVSAHRRAEVTADKAQAQRRG
jgi:L-ascorbate metabolism protein UlaG (beta-lactamase superfamily)